MNTLPLSCVFGQAIGRPLKGYVILGANLGVLLIFEGGLTVELRSLSEITASETDPDRGAD